MIGWLKKWGKRILMASAALGIAWLAGQSLWRAAMRALSSKDAAFEADEAEAQGHAEKARKKRQKAHSEIHKAADERKKAQKRIDKIDEETRHDDKDLDSVWDDWRDDRADRMRD